MISHPVAGLADLLTAADFHAPGHHPQQPATVTHNHDDVLAWRREQTGAITIAYDRGTTIETITEHRGHVLAAAVYHVATDDGLAHAATLLRYPATTVTGDDGVNRTTPAGWARAMDVCGLPADTPNQTREILAKAERLRREYAKKGGKR